MDSLAEWINASLKDADHELFKDVIRVETDIKPMGDGQVIIISEIKRVMMTLVKSNGEKRQVKAIAKIEPATGAGKFMAMDTGAFKTEIMMYSSLLKSMETVMSEVEDQTFLWPQCYLCGDNKFIFQDLCEVGYKIVPTYKFLDVDHTLLVMEGLGKFHGLSLVLMERSVIDPSKFNVPFFAKTNPAMDNMQKKSLDDFSQAVQSWGPEWSTVPERLTKYFGKPSEKMKELWTETKGKWDVLNHGDFTMRNMLFHYELDSTIPDGIKFVDFQMCHVSNLAFDLSLLLYSSLMPDIRDENMTLFLTTYTDSLVTTCRCRGFNGPLPTVDDVRASLTSLHSLNNGIALFQLPFFIQSRKQDIQEKTDEFIGTYTTDSEAKAPTGSFIDYTDPQSLEVIQSELRRCMNEHRF